MVIQQVSVQGTVPRGAKFPDTATGNLSAEKTCRTRQE